MNKVRGDMKVHIQTWISPTILADLIRWERSQGYTSPRLAASIANLLAILHNSIVKQYNLTEFVSEPEALQYLAHCGIMTTVRAKGKEDEIRRIIEVEVVEEDVKKIADDLFKIVGAE